MAPPATNLPIDNVAQTASDIGERNRSFARSFCFPCPSFPIAEFSFPVSEAQAPPTPTHTRTFLVSNVPSEHASSITDVASAAAAAGAAYTAGSMAMDSMEIING